MNSAAKWQEQLDADAGRDAFRAEAICSTVNERINPEKYMNHQEIIINHWEKGSAGVVCRKLGDVNYYSGDAVDVPYYGLRIKNNGQFQNFPASFEGYHIADIYYQCAPQIGLSIALNLRDAYNGTIAKGINPESVEKLLQLAKKVVDHFEGTDAPLGLLAKEALTASQL